MTVQKLRENNIGLNRQCLSDTKKQSISSVLELSCERKFRNDKLTRNYFENVKIDVSIFQLILIL